jgi:hypothetical protein
MREMTFELTGTPSDELPALLATGATDIGMVFVRKSDLAGGASDQYLFVVEHATPFIHRARSSAAPEE